MTAIDDVLPIDGLIGGKNVLIAGEPMTGKAAIVYEVLSRIVDGDHGFVFVTGKQTTDTVVREVESRTSLDLSPENASVIEVATGAYSESKQNPLTRIVAAGDLTGTGIAFSTRYSQIVEKKGSPVCLAIHSLSPMFMYSKVRSVYRFLHVATRTVQNHDGMGVYTVDKPAESDEVVRLQELVDGLVETRRGDAGYEVRLSGLSSMPQDWIALTS